MRINTIKHSFSEVIPAPKHQEKCAEVIPDSPKTEKTEQTVVSQSQNVTPSTPRSSRILKMLDVPKGLHQYLKMVFPLSGKRPPIIHYYSKDAQSGFLKLYEPDQRDLTTINSQQHWVLFETRSQIPPKYRGRIEKWLAYVIGTVVHHVAISKCTISIKGKKKLFLILKILYKFTVSRINMCKLLHLDPEYGFKER